MRPRLVDEIVAATRRTIGTTAATPLHTPSIQGKELEYVSQAIESTFVSSVGEFVDRFEKDICAFTGSRRAVAVSSGTAALQLALRVAGVSAGDEVLLPSLTFVATANAVSYLGATPHFVEVDEQSLSVDPEALRKWIKRTLVSKGGRLINPTSGRAVTALVVMHPFGHISRMEEQLSVGREFGLPVVEDAAEALGSKYQGKHAGRFGLVGTISFNGNKIITTGGGGVVLTEDDETADLVRHLSTTAKTPHRWEYVHDEIGYNYRMPNLNAAFGVGQLEELPKFVVAKRSLAERYIAEFSSISGASIVLEPKGSLSNYWLNTLRLDSGNTRFRDEILDEFGSIGIGARPVWTPLHLLAPYRKSPRSSMKVTEMLGSSLINLPSSAHLA